MDLHQIVPQPLNLFGQEAADTGELLSYRFGLPQRSGAMTIWPIFGLDHNGTYSPPLSGLKLSRVRGYGNVELKNPSPEGVAIVPLHIGYIQDGAQNHALCRSAFLAGGQTLMFNDACCVQQSQGGYLEERDQWFFILPLPLREKALKLRGEKNYSKLWDDIRTLNQQFGLPTRGHLEQIIGHQRVYLSQYRNRFELLAGQTGALFFLRDKLVGIEIAPSSSYFAELWMPLLCFCYGASAMYEETRVSGGASSYDEPQPFSAETLSALAAQLQQSRQELQEEVRQIVRQTPKEHFSPQEEERFLSLKLFSVDGTNFAGQFVKDDEELVYASLFAKASHLA